MGLIRRPQLRHQFLSQLVRGSARIEEQNGAGEPVPPLVLGSYLLRREVTLSRGYKSAIGA
jgi:hypothetical protein